MFGQVSELYRTGKPIKRIDTASTDKQANRFVKVLPKKMWVRLLRALQQTTCD